MAVGVVGVSFGALAPAAGLSPGMTMAMSVLVFAGGAQLLVTGVLAAGGGLVAAVAAGLVLNLRHLPFGLALAGTIGGGPWRFPAAHVITDESTAFVLARNDDPARARRAFRTLGTIKFACWQAGTALGLLLGTSIPDPSVFGLDAAFPAALLAMLVPMVRRADARRVGGGAAVVALAASPFAPAGVPVLAGLLGLGLAGRRHARTPGRGGGAGAAPRGEAGSGAGAPPARVPGRWQRVLRARSGRTQGGRS